jgi:hypothetical protein
VGSAGGCSEWATGGWCGTRVRCTSRCTSPTCLERAGRAPPPPARYAAFVHLALVHLELVHLALVHLLGWPGAPATCQHAIRAMVLKQGIGATDAGQGELNAAYGGLGLSIGVIMPYFWGRLYAFFLSPPPWVPWWLRWGGGAHMGCAGALYLLASVVLARTRDSDLFLEEGSPTPTAAAQPWRRRAQQQDQKK